MYLRVANAMRDGVGAIRTRATAKLSDRLEAGACQDQPRSVGIVDSASLCVDSMKDGCLTRLQ